MNERPPIGTMTILAIYGIVFVGFKLHDPTWARLIDAGVVEPGRVAGGEYWRLVSAAFVHIGLLHLAFNAYFLWRVGPILEHAIGLERFLLVYFVSGIAGNAAIALLYDPLFVAGGGSTSLFGMLGALLAMVLRRERSYRSFFANRAGTELIMLILANLVIGWLMPMISNTGHVGGLLGGFGITFCWLALPDAGGRPQKPALALRAGALALFVVFTFMACRPFPRCWFQAREFWHTQDADRAARIRAGLIHRGIDPAGLDFLAFAKLARTRPLSNEELRRFVTLTQRTDRIGTGLMQIGLDPPPWNGFLSAMQSHDPDVDRTIPIAPWAEQEAR